MMSSGGFNSKPKCANFHCIFPNFVAISQFATDFLPIINACPTVAHLGMVAPQFMQCLPCDGVNSPQFFARNIGVELEHGLCLIITQATHRRRWAGGTARRPHRYRGWGIGHRGRRPGRRRPWRRERAIRDACDRHAHHACIWDVCQRILTLLLSWVGLYGMDCDPLWMTSNCTGVVSWNPRDHILLVSGITNKILSRTQWTNNPNRPSRFQVYWINLMLWHLT